ncbi:Tautomerase enzyme [Nocardia amikacinitolerans]|uniref:tautomerase family protein n=1 Tax=Nocardia amikacinitolerans TaxID=756689 RepID=UPI0008339631|nr:tautomerase family protein [Nocardia amikacinitolerans]MCP2317133.1 Tautomerase enzyme [Nocardia amikacinitolerans]
MPFTVIAPRGVLTETGETQLLPQLVEALIETSGLTGNTFFTPVVGAHLHILEPDHVYTGGKNRPVLLIELKLPGIGLPTVSDRASFITTVTAIAAEHTVPGHPLDDIWVNISYAADGGWGIAGVAYTNDALVTAITSAETASAS